MRRDFSACALLIAVAVCAAAGVRHADARQAPAREGRQPPIFRGGTTLVQVDAIVTDAAGRPVIDLSASDFEVLDDGARVPIERVRFLGAAAYEGDATLAPIRTHDDEEREASRDDVRVYAIVLDDYHVERMGELRVVDALIAFVQQLPPTDLVAVYYPLDSMTDVHFARDREPVLKAIRAFRGRFGDYQPTRPVEEEHLRYPRDIERIRREITMTALEGLATHLGGIKQGRKTVLFVSSGFTEPVEELRRVYEAANRANVAVYPLDPRGMTTRRRETTTSQMMNVSVGDYDMLRALAFETGARAIVGRTDIRGEIQRITRDASAYYLIAYESPHPDDGKFHRVSVRVTRPRTTVFARTGYWSLTRGQNADGAASLAPVVPARVNEAIKRLADSLRPNADEPIEAPNRVHMPEPPPPPLPPKPPLLAALSVFLAQGRMVGPPVTRREFRRSDIVVVRAPVTGTSEIAARLLNHVGQPLADLPAAVSDGTCQVTVPLGSVAAVSDGTCQVTVPLGSVAAGDYIVEMSATAGEEAAQQLVAFRVLAR